MTNGDRIRQMSDQELAAFMETMLSGENDHDIACYACINYGTHHWHERYFGDASCGDCRWRDIGQDLTKWLQEESEEGQ